MLFSIIKKEYEKILYLEELKNNKFLSICDSIDEMYDQIIIELKNNNKKAIIEDNNQINIIIPINHIKVKEIIFTLPEKNNPDKDLFQELLVEINNLKKENREFKEKFNKIEKDNNELKEEILIIKEENKKLNEKIDSIINKKDIKDINDIKDIKDIKELKKKNDLPKKNELNLENNILYQGDELFNFSIILKSDINQINQIKDWIKEKTDQKSIEFKFIFRMSKHGDKGTDFHKYCDNEAPTLIIIKSKKNNIFGGFTPLYWGKEDFPKDELNQTFVFSLDRNKKFDIINNKNYAIRCYKEEGPVFGNCDIKIGKNMRKIESYSKGKGNFFATNNLEITGEKGGHESLETEELEVFKVIF